MDWTEAWLDEESGEVPTAYRLRNNPELRPMAAFGALAALFYVALGTVGASGDLVLGIPVLMWLTVGTGLAFLVTLVVAGKTGNSARSDGRDEG